LHLAVLLFFVFAVIMALPAFLAVITPLFTDTISLLLELQMIVLSSLGFSGLNVTFKVSLFPLYKTKLLLFK